LEYSKPGTRENQQMREEGRKVEIHNHQSVKKIREATEIWSFEINI
jgi:hypothetical protein